MQSQDYLKYWRVVRYFIKKKYNLTTSDLEMLLFLKSEGRFSKENFQEFNELLSWDKSRFERLRPNVRFGDSHSLCMYPISNPKSVDVPLPLSLPAPISTRCW